MATNSKIEWTDVTWNPLAGCTRVSPGCDNCYAAKMALRLEAMALADIEAGKDPGGKRKYIGVATKNGRGVAVFNDTINLDEDELQRPYSWRKPRRVFVNSMSDLFHKDVPDRFIAAVFDTMAKTPQHTYQVLTKRPERAAEWSKKYSFYVGLWPDNVWIGTSVENQEQADKRIPELLRIPAAVHYLSMEPLLGPVDLTKLPSFYDGHKRPLLRLNALRGGHWVGNAETGYWGPDNELDNPPRVRWVIVGGESGPNARPMRPDWARSIRDQCQAAVIPFFFKQHGVWIEAKYAPDAKLTDELTAIVDPDGSVRKNGVVGFGKVMAKVGKRAAGRLLDGREWNEFPQAVTV